MDSRTEANFRQEKARRSYAGVPERAGHLQQQVRYSHELLSLYIYSGQMSNSKPVFSLMVRPVKESSGQFLFM